MAEFRDWREAYKLSRARLLENRLRRASGQQPRPFKSGDLSDADVQRIEDSNAKHAQEAPFRAESDPWFPQVGTPEFSRKAPPPEPYNEQVFFRKNGKSYVRIYSSKTGLPLKDQYHARKRMLARRAREYQQMLASSVPGTEVPLP